MARGLNDRAHSRPINVARPLVCKKHSTCQCARLADVDAGRRRAHRNTSALLVEALSFNSEEMESDDGSSLNELPDSTFI